MGRATRRTAQEPRGNAEVVRPAVFQGDDAQLVKALRGGSREARARLFDRHAPRVKRILTRLLGHHDELADVLHDVFVQALRDIHKLKDPNALRAWLTRIAVFTARGRIRKASRRRWLRLLPPERLPEMEAPARGDDVGEALRATYAVLMELSADERVALALRFIEGMELKQVAAACDVSLATIKRRLRRAEARFVDSAKQHPVLQTWLREGTRWGEQ